MEKLLEIAKKHADSAEVFYTSYNSNKIQSSNSSLIDIENKIQSGYALRIIKDGFMGSSYTKNLIDRQSLVDNALNSLKGKAKAQFSFSDSHSPKEIKTYASEIENVTCEKAVKEQKRICSVLKSKTSGQINVVSSFGSSDLKIMNTQGLDVKKRNSYYYAYPYINFPNSYASISNNVFSTSMIDFPEDKLVEVANLFNSASNYVETKSAPISVIFLPGTFYAIKWRIASALNAMSVYQGVSPVKEKLGEKIFSSKLTLINDPETENRSDSRCFDDEGTPSYKFPIVKEGRLESFFTNLDFAEKLGIKPTGHGFRENPWGGETIAAKPTPSLPHLKMQTGDKTLKEMIRNTKKGILLAGCLGAHSGNIPNGDFSIGLNPGLYIENGEIKGRVKDGMIAGNIYDMLKNINSIENEVHEAQGGRFPAVCFDNVNFSVK